MRQVIYDTHTLIRGLIDPNEPYVGLLRLPEGWKLCLSDLILREALQVLLGTSRLSIVLDRLRQIPLAEAYQRASTGEVYPVPPDIEIEICTDPEDNKFLASALALDCDFLVTEVPELLDLERNKEWQEFKRTNSVRVEVLDPASFSRLVAEARP
ncbi:MAG: PIN domain-containing protein [Candidatus Riflebacteria bacterium]|nr:PIN domain-containing protein [Candidatus Riflebacteria bacterium]